MARLRSAGEALPADMFAGAGMTIPTAVILDGIGFYASIAIFFIGNAARTITVAGITRQAGAGLSQVGDPRSRRKAVFQGRSAGCGLRRRCRASNYSGTRP